MEISLQELAGGALQEKVNQAFEKVMQNMQDPNTPWKNKRKITVGITFDRMRIALTVPVIFRWIQNLQRLSR